MTRFRCAGRRFLSYCSSAVRIELTAVGSKREWTNGGSRKRESARKSDHYDRPNFTTEKRRRPSTTSVLAAAIFPLRNQACP